MLYFLLFLYFFPLFLIYLILSFTLPLIKIGTISLPDNDFDVIVCTDVLEHVQEDKDV